jgi:hypothetical protein
MFWDGERWVPDEGPSKAKALPKLSTPRQARDWVATAAMIIVVAGLAIPFAGTMATTRSARPVVAKWASTTDVSVVQESSRQITYSGSWFTAYYSDYLGGKARSTSTAGSKASLRFTGAAVMWVGPVGPTRGKAKVYIDGNLVTTVNTWSSSFRPTRVLFQRSWATVKTHRITIVALGTAGHPTVALDGFVVRLRLADTAAPVDDGGAPIGTAPPEPPVAEPTADPTAKPTQAPTDAPAADPTQAPTDAPAADPTQAPTDAPAADPTQAPTSAPTPAGTSAPTPAPTQAPVATPKPTAAPTQAPVATPKPTAAPTQAPVATPKPTAAPTATPAPAGTSVRVTSIPALLSALADDAVTQITVADGTYRVSPASSQASNSLWIGSRFAGRTRAVTIRAETTGGVIFDGGGSNSFGGITFVAGAHDQTWEGFTWANGTPTGPSGQGSGTGVVVFGGYAGQAAPHHITLRDSTVRPTAGSYIGGHAVYFSWAASPGAHDIVLDGLTVDDPRGLITAALHFYHSDAANLNASRVTVRNLRVAGTTQAVMIWDPTVHDVLIEDSVVTGAKQTAVSYEEGSAITLRRVTSTGSGVVGFYSSLGPNPPGVTFIDTSLH